MQMLHTNHLPHLTDRNILYKTEHDLDNTNTTGACPQEASPYQDHSRTGVQSNHLEKRPGLTAFDMVPIIKMFTPYNYYPIFDIFQYSICVVNILTIILPFMWVLISFSVTENFMWP